MSITRLSITRRIFLRNGALAVVGTTTLPSFLTRAAFGAADPGVRTKRLVVIFQRGAADGLNIVVPHGEPSYYAMRPTINVPKKSVLDLDGFFGLHPAMTSFQPLWKQKHLAIVHAAGSPDPTRSHFDAQDFMESGTPGMKVTDDGWLNRALRDLPPDNSRDKPAFRAIGLGQSLPRILSGKEPAVAVKTLKAADPAHHTPAANANYPKGRFGDSLKQLAQLIKANLGVQIAFADIGGWDHHVNEGSTQGQIANVLGDFSQSIAAFWTDLGDLGEDTVVVTMSEFGRTARENGNRGTDHGHANVMFVLGGPVKGGKIYGRWPGLDQSQLYEGRDLAVTTDFRLVLSEFVSQYLGNKDLRTVFPGFEGQPGQFVRLLG
jgi:uncharacterized protein (DUF1501 family)